MYLIIKHRLNAQPKLSYSDGCTTVQPKVDLVFSKSAMTEQHCAFQEQCVLNPLWMPQYISKTAVANNKLDFIGIS